MLLRFKNQECLKLVTGTAIDVAMKTIATNPNATSADWPEISVRRCKRFKLWTRPRDSSFQEPDMVNQLCLNMLFLRSRNKSCTFTSILILTRCQTRPFQLLRTPSHHSRTTTSPIRTRLSWTDPWWSRPLLWTPSPTGSQSLQLQWPQSKMDSLNQDKPRKDSNQSTFGDLPPPNGTIELIYLPSNFVSYSNLTSNISKYRERRSSWI